MAISLTDRLWISPRRRREFCLAVLRAALSLALFGGLFAATATAQEPDRPRRPNILWITSEDNSAYLGCYGDPQALTPRLDRLAAEGVRYRRAFANAPVCSTARTTLITGMYPTSLGAVHHRSRVRIPAPFRLFPEYLREQGYYCTNNAKTDYNVVAKSPWDESSNQAHYRNRPAGQPFFAVFNLMTTHESQVAPPGGNPPAEVGQEPVKRSDDERTKAARFRLAPDEVRLPPYHPDTPEIRRDWAHYYDRLTQMDRQVGTLLDELDQAGLADETIVFYFSDHGGALPRGKRNIHDSGTHVPLIVRIPARWSHLAPAAAGEWVERPVSFVDFPATVLQLAGASIPPHFQGRPFLGSDAPQREHVLLYRGRMDERYDHVRAVRLGEFRYVRNYSPHRPWGQAYSYPFRVLPSMRSWHAAWAAGECDAEQSRYWQPKPAEELYRPGDDPHEIRNLIDEASANVSEKQRAELRELLRKELIATRDAGFIPEALAEELAGEGTIYEYAQSDAYPIERVVAIADLAAAGDPAQAPALAEALRDEHPVVRYWAATGGLILHQRAASSGASAARSMALSEALLQALQDPVADVRIVAAEALGYSGQAEAAAQTLQNVLASGTHYQRLAALNALDFLVDAGHVRLEQAQTMVRNLQLNEPADRIQRRLLERIPAAAPGG